MNQPYPQLDTKTIATLKAARNQVIQATRPPPHQISTAPAAPLAVKDKRESTIVPAVSAAQPSSPGQVLNKFGEEFVQKLASIERETAAIDEEIAKVEKLWSTLVEKKKQLEARRNELIKVKNKLKELDKEMSAMLKSQSV